MPRVIVALLAALLLSSACKSRPAKTAVTAVQLGDKTQADRIRGFYEINGAWRWTARVFDVTLDAPAGQSATYLEFDCAVPAEVMDQDPALTLIAWVNGVEVGRQTWYASGPCRFTRYVPDAALRQRPVNVHFELNRSVTSPEGRELGMIGVDVALKPWEDTAEYESQKTWFARDGIKAAGSLRETRFPAQKQLELIRTFESLPVAANAAFEGIPVDRNPLDLWMGQQILFEVRPDFVIETGSAQGGSSLYWAHVLHGMNLVNSRVLAVDSVNRTQEAAKRFLWPKYVDFTQASPTASSTASGIAGKVRNRRTVVFIGGTPDANQVLEQLDLYAPLVSPGSYLVVQNTYLDRESSTRGAGPYQAVQRFLLRGGAEHFEPDLSRELMVFTRNPGGWLRRKP